MPCNKGLSHTMLSWPLQPPCACCLPAQPVLLSPPSLLHFCNGRSNQAISLFTGLYWSMAFESTACAYLHQSHRVVCWQDEHVAVVALVGAPQPWQSPAWLAAPLDSPLHAGSQPILGQGASEQSSECSSDESDAGREQPIMGAHASAKQASIAGQQALSINSRAQCHPTAGKGASAPKPGGDTWWQLVSGNDIQAVFCAGCKQWL